MPPERVLIMAVSENDAIGYKGKLPWKRIPEDMERFHRKIRGNITVMGRKTCESISEKTLDSWGSFNITVSRNKDFRHDGVRVVHSVEEALEASELLYDLSSLTPNGKHPKIYFAGGGALCEEVLRKEYVDTIELTRVLRAYPADTFFPLFNRSEWAVADSERHPNFIFLTYRRKQK